MKEDNSIVHLKWSVENRAVTLRTSVNLLRLFKEHSKSIKEKENTAVAQNLLSVAFSLWRAVFLANRTGQREARIDAATAFLQKMIADNAISFATDLEGREWTFNYYMTNATNSLLALPWEDIHEMVVPKAKAKGDKASVSVRRWNRCQAAFDAAVRRFETELND
jgi:hypothetical protein